MAEEIKNNNSRAGALDDEQRVKVLSPSMLVFRRFIRNRLAIVGTVFIVFMFAFAFLGGWISPYGEDEVFTHYQSLEKDYVSVTVNEDLRYTLNEGADFPSIAQSKFILAINTGEEVFESQKMQYSIEKRGEDLYVISAVKQVAQGISSKVSTKINPAQGQTMPEGLEAATQAAIDANQTEFELGGVDYIISFSGKEVMVGTGAPVALASKTVYDTKDVDTEIDYAFSLAAETAIDQGATSFEVDGTTYQLEIEPGVGATITLDGDIYALASNMVINSYIAGQNPSLGFKDAAKEAIAQGNDSFVFEDATYTIYRNNFVWDIKSEVQSLVVNSYEAPSGVHWLGTDGNGMDLLTRIMYGGRVSLIIGFIVVFISAFLGVVLGGVAGYFGKWVDSLIMRVVDIFNCIPSTPLIIILGSIMDAERVDPQIRMIYLMLILGFLSWPGVARMVRGQILSLREQEFMTATEACGLSVSHRIFRHLVPNVIPQLIVLCTMSLGSTIITESTLSFLGLGVKFPFASWGNIISAVSTVHVMTNYWFVWIPAGLCILLTVLGFNFIGDGLRDAFDPKMKR